MDLGIEEITQVLSKLDEEVSELRRAIESRDLTAIADGLADTVYVTAGIAVQFGIDIDAVIDVVHRSNMTKVPSGEGEASKGADYCAPEIHELLARMKIKG